MAAPRSVSMQVFAKAMSMLLRKKHACVEDIVDVTGLHNTTAARLVHALHAERLVHIGGWIQDTLGRDQTPVYHLGEGDDVPRRKQSGATRNRLYRARQRTNQKEI